MPKSNSRGRFGGRSGGTVTVIEAQVHRTFAENAKLAFILTALIVGVLSMIVAADFMHPILALFLGAVIGLVTAVIVWAVVRIWPVIRLIWWWATEILLAVFLVYGWIALATHTILVSRLVIVGLVVGVPAAVGPIRRRVVAVAWCLIVRHRLRVCFNQFIVANRSGSLPLILWAHPTPVGERVWIWLRPGLSVTDLQSRLDKVAVTCWASAVMVEAASDRNAAYVRVDVKRRQVLTATVGSPLAEMVDPDDLGIPQTKRAANGTSVDGLDLPDVPAEPVESAGKRKPPPRPPAAPAPAASSVKGSNGEDITDWI